MPSRVGFKLYNKLVGDWISAPSPNFVDPQSMTHRLIGDFVQILGRKFWALGGLNQKSKNNVL